MAIPSEKSVSYTLSNQAYLKIILHAAKYPHRSVNGVLLGNLSGSGVVIDDSIPLLHHWTSLSPMMEVGLDLVSFLVPCLVLMHRPVDRNDKAQTHAAVVGLKLVGYYQACSRIDDTSLAPVGEKVAERVRGGFKDAVAFVVRFSLNLNDTVTEVTNRLMGKS
jgi:ER membrane protein complex subunit 8/9